MGGISASIQATPKSSRINGAYPRLDKKQIEQRIEEDRERHKRLRENIWAVPQAGIDDREFQKMWDETSDVGEDDYLLYEEEAAEREEAAKDWEEEYKNRVTGNEVP